MTRPRDPVDLDELRWAIRNGRPVVVPDIDVAVCDVEGQPFCFASDRLEDPVQRQNRNGKFYEEEELDNELYNKKMKAEARFRKYRFTT